MPPADDAPVGESEPLSIDQAVELLAGPEADSDEIDEALDADEVETDLVDAGPVQPPHFWGAEDKAAFSELPPHLQEKVAAYEKNRDDAAARAIEEAALARNAAQTQAAATGELAARLEAVVPQAEAAFVSRWGAGEPDWDAVAQVHGPEAALRLKGEFDREQVELQRLGAARQEAEAVQHATFVAVEYDKLRSLAPELAGEGRGAYRREAVGRFLMDAGVSGEQLAHLSAIEMALAYDAMRYRLADATLARPARGRSARPSLAPAAAQATRSSQQRRVEGARSRFAQKPSIDNAVAAILAKS